MFHIAQDDDLVPLIIYDKYTLKTEGTGKYWQSRDTVNTGHRHRTKTKHRAKHIKLKSALTKKNQGWT